MSMKVLSLLAILTFGGISHSACQMIFEEAPHTSLSKKQSTSAYPEDLGSRCPKQLFRKVGGNPIYRIPGEDPFFFKAGMRIDADGAPNAYHPEDLGLDLLKHAGKPGDWQGIVTDERGQPIQQGPHDPFPGYYISQTSLFDKTKERTDPRRYVDAREIPYIVLPKEEGFEKVSGLRLGDFAAVIDARKRRVGYAIYADIGPKGKIGEGSIALGEALQFPSSPRTGGVAGDVIYLVFPGSGNGQPRTLREINVAVERLFKAWGGMARVAACFPEY